MKKILLSIPIFLLVINSASHSGILEATNARAIKGDPASQFQLGMLAENSGKYDEAYQWYLAAAKNGNSNAQFQLGKMYVTGDYSLPRDYRRAYLWFYLSAACGNEQALNYRDNLANQLSSSERDSMNNEIKLWLRSFHKR